MAQTTTITAISRYFSDDPSMVAIITTADLTTITTAGYLLNEADNIALLNNGAFEWLPSDIVLIFYSPDLIGFFTHDVTNDTFISLAPNAGLSNTLSSGDIFVGNGANIATGVPVTGAITMSNAGLTAIVPNYITNAMINSAAAIAFSKLATLATGHVLVGNAGVVTDALLSGDATIGATGVMTLDPTLQLGASGTASSLTMFPPTAANGFFELLPVNAGGAFNTVISNGTMGQTTTYTIPDIGASTGGIVVSTAAVRMKSVAGAAAAGGNAAQSFSDAFCTSGSMVVGNWNTQANPAVVQKIVPGNGSFVVTSDTDAGVGTFNYIITK